MDHGILALLNPVEFFYWGINLLPSTYPILSPKPTSWAKPGRRLKANFALKEWQSCARSQSRNCSWIPGLIHQEELGCGSQGNSRHKCCWGNKNQAQVCSVNFLSGTCMGHSTHIMVYLQKCIYRNGVFLNGVFTENATIFLINGSCVFLA